MNVPSWQHTKPLPQPTRHRMRGRTDFEDSLLSARREEQAKEKRRFQALTEALKARGIPSDKKDMISGRGDWPPSAGYGGFLGRQG